MGLAMGALASPGCTDAPLACGGLATLDDFLTCRPLCQDDLTSVSCDAGQPERALAALLAWHGFAEELSGTDGVSSSSYESRRVGMWVLRDVTHADRVGIDAVPFFGVVSTDPPPRVRTTWNDGEALPEGVTFFLHTVGGVAGCALHYGVVAHWSPRSSSSVDSCVVGGRFSVSSLLLETHGYCDGTVPAAQAASRREGLLIVPRVADLEYCEFWSCQEDGQCEMRCRIDYDCPCHSDGLCSLSTCVADADCPCEADHHCVPGCDLDPDCACIANGDCNVGCGILDPDCDCREDGACDTRCLADDPDCGCGPDGVCPPSCGLFDPDCACQNDGYCNMDACGPTGDPDCPGGG